MPYLHGLPMTTGKPYLASDGHTDAVRVLVDVHSSLDIPSARFDQFISDEKVRKIGSFYKREKNGQQPLEEMEEDKEEEESVEEQKDKEKTGLSCSMKIDKSALPIVSDIIKRLEKPKGLRALSPLINRQKPVFSPKPKVKPKPLRKTIKQSPVAPLVTDSPVAPLVTDSTSTLEQDREESEAGTTTPTNTEDPSQLLSLTEALHSLSVNDTNPSYDQVPLKDGEKMPDKVLSKNPVSDYETPVKTHAYNGVPVETGLESTSDPEISLQRYEGDSPVSLGEGLYDNCKISTLAMSIPGRDNFVNDVNDGHVFVLTGGRGLVNFRPNDESSRSIILSLRKQDVAANSIAFQIPK